MAKRSRHIISAFVTRFLSILIMDAPSSVNYFSGIIKSISQLRTIHELKCFISPAWYQTYLGTCVWVSVVRVRFIRKKNVLRYRKTQSCHILNLRTLDFTFWLSPVLLNHQFYLFVCSPPFHHFRNSHQLTILWIYNIVDVSILLKTDRESGESWNQCRRKESIGKQEWNILNI